MTLICAIFATSFTVLITTGEPNQDATVEWYESITKSATLTWRCDTYEVDPLSEPMLGGLGFSINSEIQIMVTQEPSSSYNDLYNVDLPFYFDYYLDGVGFNPSTGGALDTDVIRAFLWPLSIEWGNDSTTDLYQFLGWYSPSSFNSTTVNPVGTHVHLVWTNESLMNPEQFTVTFAVFLGTGISDHIHFYNQSFNWGWTFVGVELPEPTSATISEGDGGEPPTKITWSDSLKKGTILAWNVTTFNQIGGDPFTLGDTNIKTGDILQLGLIKNPPTNPEEWLDPQEPPDWVQIFVNSQEIDLANIGEEGEFFLFMMVPLEYIFDNGSVYAMKDFFDIFLGKDSDFSHYSRSTVDGIYYNVSWREEWTDNGESGWAHHYLLSTIETGITVKRHVQASNGVMTWEFFEKAANMDPEEGTAQAIESEFDVSLEYPPPDLISGFDLIPLLLACGLILVIKRKRN